eukprot:snap_masked-scaffold_45-processed-gene-1.89-mRNA-1 protein AED:1.00 eAED:1.00 QI:0/-1/0/0/-1/1/1/0/70
MQATGKEPPEKERSSQLEAEEVEVEKRLKLKKNQRRARKAFYSRIEIKGNLNSEKKTGEIESSKVCKRNS